MSYANYSVSAIQVKILLPLVVPHMAALAFHNVDVEEWIYWK